MFIPELCQDSEIWKMTSIKVVEVIGSHHLFTLNLTLVIFKVIQMSTFVFQIITPISDGTVENTLQTTQAKRVYVINPKYALLEVWIT